MEIEVPICLARGNNLISTKPFVIVFPNCKINLALRIIRKRNDGYHDLETVFYPVNVKDVLEIIPRSSQDVPPTNDERNLVSFSNTGLTIPGESKDNLCIKAYDQLKKDHPDLPAVKMHLHKMIPIGAGLGGGSSDAAFALKLLNEKFNLQLTTIQLIAYAVQLGSDCPFFIVNKPCFASSRGEMMEEISLDLSLYSNVLVNPGLHINTGWAVSELTTGEGPPHPQQDESLAELIMLPVTRWREVLTNDLEGPVFKKYPEIKTIKDELYRNGALYAAMTGSGSTVFGIFEKKELVLTDERMIWVES